MIELKNVRDRLDELQSLCYVGDSISGADAMENMNARPDSAFVSTSGARGAPSKLATGKVRQRVVQNVSVVFCIGQESAADDQTDTMEERWQEILYALLGWTPPGAGGPFNFVSFGVRFIGEGLIWGEVIMAAPLLISSVD